MRDIRNDLQERVKMMEAKVEAANAHFEKMIKRLQRERDGAIAGLKARIEMTHKLLEFEQQDMGKAAPAPTATSPKLALAG
jgi:hypothetical protein